MDSRIRDRIPFLKFVMMCFIIFYHCALNLYYAYFHSAGDKLLNYAIEFTASDFAALAMLVFFTISGFLLFYNLTFSNYREKLKRRCSTLLLPYLLWQLIYTGKGLLQGSSWTLKDWLAKVFLFQVWPPLGAFWYVYILFLLAVLSPLFLLLFRNKWAGWLSVIGALAVMYWLEANWLSIPFRGSLGYLMNVAMYFPGYIIGAFYGSLFQKKEEKNGILWYAVAILLAAIVIDGFFHGFLRKTILSVLPIVLLFLLPVRPWMVDRKIFRISFLMYATHQSIISLLLERIRSLLAAVSPYTWVVNLGGRVLCILAIIAVNALLYSLLKKLSPRLLSALTGAREN